MDTTRGRWANEGDLILEEEPRRGFAQLQTIFDCFGSENSAVRLGGPCEEPCCG